MAQKISTRQLRQHTVLPMVGNTADEQLDSLLLKIDAQTAKLFEDRNVLLTDGGIVTYTGTSVQFTEDLNLVLNQKISGATPQVISLGSANRTLSASGRMIYAVIDRGAGTAVVTDDATTLPAVVAANQEVFLIAKRVDATDGTQRLYFRTGAAFNAGQSARLGSAGSGSGGSGTGDDLNALTFKASFTDLFDDIPSSATSGVDTTAGKTDPTLYSAVNALFQLNYDASKTVTTVGTAATLSATPSFTVKDGDMLINGQNSRRIATVNTQTSYVLESAFPVDLTTAAACVSQAVHSKDINAYAGDGLAPSVAFSTTIGQIMAIYEDTSTAGDKIFDANTAPVVGFSASSDGSSYSTTQLRPTNLTDTVEMTTLPTSSTSLYIRFFANKTSGTGTVNLLGYKAFFHRDAAFQDGMIMNQASALLNGVGTQINIAQIAVTSGKTRVKTSWAFPVGVNSGTANGALKVYINGQKVPRFVSASATPDSSYIEIDQNTIELDADYSSLGLLIEIIQDVAVVDASDTNVTSISQIQESTGEGFQGFVKASQTISPTTAVGAPGAGLFHSSITNRASIVDLTQDLSVKMGINRIMTHSISLMQGESGSAGQPVSSVPNDPIGMIRFAGVWVAQQTAGGPNTSITGNQTGDYFEVTFFGTGINLLTNVNTTAFDARVSVDGAAESGNVMPNANPFLNGRNYNSNTVVRLASGLSLGVHTVRVRNAGTNGFNVSGVEIINDVSSLRVAAGSAFVAGRKVTLSSSLSPSYNSSFDSGTLGNRGGRVLTYIKSDGSFGKSVNPAGTQLNLSSADHSNEEMVRSYNFREFGAGRADDMSLLAPANTDVAFVLDDNSTSVHGSQVSAGQVGSSMATILGGATSYLIFTFIGTGLDIIQRDGAVGTLDTYSVAVDGSSIGNLSTVASSNHRVTKIVSGLPYGTHTVRISRTTAANQALGIVNFMVYQPKKPNLPSGAIELGEYIVLADYSADPTGSAESVSSGVIRKSGLREIIYGGTWSGGINLILGDVGGWTVRSTTNNDYVEYSFFGSSVEVLARGGSGSVTSTVQIDGVAFTGSGSSTSGGSWTPGTSTWVSSSSFGSALRLTGLSLGFHTIRVTFTATANTVNFNGFNIATAINSQKSNTPSEIQNALTVGSQSIGDLRRWTPVKDLLPIQKGWAQARGVTSNPTTTSTVLIPMPDMSVTVKTSGGRLGIKFRTQCSSSVTNATPSISIYVNGQAVGVPDSGSITAPATAGFQFSVSNECVIPVSAGVHKVEVFYTNGNAGTLTLSGTNRILIVEET